MALLRPHEGPASARCSDDQSIDNAVQRRRRHVLISQKALQIAEENHQFPSTGYWLLMRIREWQYLSQMGRDGQDNVILQLAHSCSRKKESDRSRASMGNVRLNPIFLTTLPIHAFWYINSIHTTPTIKIQTITKGIEFFSVHHLSSLLLASFVPSCPLFFQARYITR